MKLLRINSLFILRVFFFSLILFLFSQYHTAYSATEVVPNFPGKNSCDADALDINKDKWECSNSSDQQNFGKSVVLHHSWTPWHGWGMSNEYFVCPEYKGQNSTCRKVNSCVQCVINTQSSAPTPSGMPSTPPAPDAPEPSMPTPPATDTCTTVGNSTIGNQREYECESSCSSGRSQYSGRNSSCTTGICCQLVAPSTGDNGTPPEPSAAPKLPEPGIGHCGNDQRLNGKPVGSPSCTINNATWVGPGKNSYCVENYSGSAEYFYQCPPTTTTPIPTTTPTPYTPQPIGGDCNPLQGTWQCQGGGYCSQACTSGSASSCTVGKCCAYGTSWNGTACVADPTPTEPPTGTAPTAAPTPISTGDACPDVNPGTNPPVFNVCRPSAPGCLTAEGETPKASSGAHDACSRFYGGSYLCCQRPPATGASGSSCNKTPVRTCDTSGNTSTGTNIQCTGCGGYCVPDSSGSSVGRCMNQYY